VLCKVLELLKRFTGNNIDGSLQGTLLDTVFMKGGLMETNGKDYAWRSS
jgi:hypothetical protein